MLRTPCRTGWGRPRPAPSGSASSISRLDRRAQDRLDHLRHRLDAGADTEDLRAATAAGARRPAAAWSAARRGRPSRRSPGRSARAAPRHARLCAASPRRTRMTVSRLLKSCATPPVSRPIASSFCAWASASACALHLVLRPLALGDVAGDLGEADVPPCLVVDRVDHDAGPEPLAVLAHAPAPRSRTCLSRSAVCSARAGSPRCAVLRRVEAREMLADDLVGRIALDQLRRRRSSWSRVPSGSSM